METPGRKKQLIFLTKVDPFCLSARGSPLHFRSDGPARTPVATAGIGEAAGCGFIRCKFLILDSWSTPGTDPIRFVPFPTGRNLI